MTSNLRTESLAEALSTVIHEGTKAGKSAHDIAIECMHVCGRYSEDIEELAEQASKERQRELTQEATARLNTIRYRPRGLPQWPDGSLTQDCAIGKNLDAKA